MSSYHDRFTPAYHDHQREHRKHDWRPGDAPAHRFDIPISTALETIVLIKGMKDPREAAKLLDQYTNTALAAARIDRNIDGMEAIARAMPERFAAAQLIGFCEGLCSDGSLGRQEPQMRLLIAKALSAFCMPSKADREPANAQA